MDYNFKDSIQKLYNIIAFSTQEPTTWEIEYKGKPYVATFPGVSQLKLGPSFFRDDACHACGKCCSSLGFYLFLTESDFESNPRKDIFSEFKIGGKSIYTTSFTTEQGCPFFVNKLCSIHLNKPIHCSFPHLRIKTTAGYGLLTKEPYGRRWIKKEQDRCPIGSDSFGEYTDAGKDVDIRILEHLIRVKKDLGIRTNLVEEVVEKLRRMKCQDSAQLTLL